MIFIEHKTKPDNAEQESFGSTSSVRVAFQDGGTGGGNPKQRFNDGTG
jgi:hypothetical protein